MLTVMLVLVLGVFVALLGCAVGRISIVPAVFLLALIELIQQVPLGK